MIRDLDDAREILSTLTPSALRRLREIPEQPQTRRYTGTTIAWLYRLQSKGLIHVKREFGRGGALDSRLPLGTTVAMLSEAS